MVAVIPGVCVGAHDGLDGGSKSAVILVSNVVRGAVDAICLNQLTGSSLYARDHVGVEAPGYSLQVQHGISNTFY